MYTLSFADAGHIPKAVNHFGTSHTGGVNSMASALHNRSPWQRHQQGHGARATRMEAQSASELAGRAASQVAMATIPGYAGHLPGDNLGAFGTSNWRRSAAASTRHAPAGQPVPREQVHNVIEHVTPRTVWARKREERQREPTSVPRMANLALCA